MEAPIAAKEVTMSRKRSFARSEAPGWLVVHRAKLAATLGAALALAGCCVPPPSVVLPETLHGQHQSNWCWAASGQMITEYFGHGVSQCRQVNDQKSMSNCCNLPTPAACNLGGTTRIDNYGFTRTVATTPVPYKSLECELSSDRRAMIFDLRWDGGGGHTITLIGYDATNNQQWLWVNNPLPVDAGSTYLLSYDDYVDGPGYYYGRTEWGIQYTGGH
jgi:hypothetical protein